MAAGRARGRGRAGSRVARSTSASRGGGSVTRGGSDRRIGSRCARPDGSRACARISSGARRRGSRTASRPRRPRRRSCRGSPGAPTSRSAARRRPSPTRSASRSSITPRAGTTTRAARRQRSSRAIQLYHVQGNGWNDIGYNFLVDRFGTIYEGRFGGSERNVVGAHAQGFNTGSVGIALLGTYGSTAPSQAAQEAIAELVSWRLDLAHVDPTAALTFVSGGSNRFPSGVPVLLRGVSGHRDTGFTECPGNQLYARLNGLARPRPLGSGCRRSTSHASSRAKVSSASARRLSSSQPWVVVVTDAGRAEVARGAGTGTTVDWTWDSTPRSRRAATRGRSGAAPRDRRPGRCESEARACRLAIQAIAATPEAITPNGDGQGDAAVAELSPDRCRERHRRGRGRGRGRRSRRSSIESGRVPASTRSPSTATSLARRVVQRSRAGSHACGSRGREDDPVAREPHAWASSP